MDEANGRPIAFSAFERVEMHVGTVLRVTPHPGARHPAYVLEIDFGPLGVKTSSAQLTRHYTPGDLVGHQVVAVTNLAPRRVAGVVSEVLVLAAVSDTAGTILLRPTHPTPDGARIA